MTILVRWRGGERKYFAGYACGKYVWKRRQAKAMPFESVAAFRRFEAECSKSCMVGAEEGSICYNPWRRTEIVLVRLKPRASGCDEDPQVCSPLQTGSSNGKLEEK